MGRRFLQPSTRSSGSCGWRRLVQRVRGLDAAEAIRLAADLGRTLDQLIVEEVEPIRLRELTADLPELAGHWQSSLDALELILRQWPAELAELGRVDLATRRNHLLDALERRWRAAPPGGFVCAAGINISAPRWRGCCGGWR
jgi:ATP-dependent helicase/nuclease subunit B